MILVWKGTQWNPLWAYPQFGSNYALISKWCFHFTPNIHGNMSFTVLWKNLLLLLIGLEMLTLEPGKPLKPGDPFSEGRLISMTSPGSPYRRKEKVFINIIWLISYALKEVCHCNVEACALWNEIIAFCPVKPGGPCGDKKVWIILTIMTSNTSVSAWQYACNFEMWHKCDNTYWWTH